MRVLLIEDDRDTAAYITNGLEEEGHTVDHLSDGQDGAVQAVGEDYDIVILDRMLPGLDGLTLVKTIRGAGRKVPVIFLTALGGIDDRVDGLDAGGDDYLVKPFAFSELLSSPRRSTAGFWSWARTFPNRAMTWTPAIVSCWS